MYKSPAENEVTLIVNAFKAIKSEKLQAQTNDTYYSSILNLLAASQYRDQVIPRVMSFLESAGMTHYFYVPNVIKYMENPAKLDQRKKEMDKDERRNYSAARFQRDTVEACNNNQRYVTGYDRYEY